MTLTLPSNLDVVRDTLLDATSELHDLLYGFQNLLSSYGSVCAFAVSPKIKIYTVYPTWFSYSFAPVFVLPETTPYHKSRV